MQGRLSFPSAVTPDIQSQLSENNEVESEDDYNVPVNSLLSKDSLSELDTALLNSNVRELMKMNELYQTLSGQFNGKGESSGLKPISLAEILFNNKNSLRLKRISKSKPNMYSAEEENPRLLDFHTKNSTINANNKEISADEQNCDKSRVIFKLDSE